MTGRVVYLLRNYPSLSQTFVRNEVFALRTTGLDVHVVALRETPDEHVPPGWGGQCDLAPRVSRRRGLLDLARIGVRHPGRLVRLARLLRATGSRERWTTLRMLPTVARGLPGRTVACHTHFAFENAYPTLYLAALLGCPASLTVHAADIYRDPAASAHLLALFDTVVTVCEYNVGVLTRAGLTSPRPVVVPCGVALPTGESLLPPANAAPTVLSVGRFVPKKGFDVLVRAWPAVLSAVPGARLDLVGDGPERARVETLVADLGLGDSVRFLGARPNSEVLRRIAATDVFTLACAVPPDGDTDALPVVLREAMARSRPVVTTRVAGVPEALDETSGWLVAPADPPALATALTQALQEVDEAARRGTAARGRIERTATLDLAARQLADVLTGRPHAGGTP